jgi:2'-5' RNA ligase
MELKNFCDFINEKRTFEYDCLMYDLPLEDLDNYLSIIDKNDILNQDGLGLEKDPHITLVYGFHSDEINRDSIIKDAIDYGNINIKIKSIGVFEGDDYDVVKLEVEDNENLTEIRNMLLNKYPNTQSFPDYHPHATLAYVKSGTGKKYTQKLDKPIEYKLDTILYSSVDGNKTKHYIND